MIYIRACGFRRSYVLEEHTILCDNKSARNKRYRNRKYIRFNSPPSRIARQFEAQRARYLKTTQKKTFLRLIFKPWKGLFLCGFDGSQQKFNTRSCLSANENACFIPASFFNCSFCFTLSKICTTFLVIVQPLLSV